MNTSKQKIQTLHPDPNKSGRNISKDIYELVKGAFLTVSEDKALTHSELMDTMEKGLADKFGGSIGWYSETVKLDLEARGVVQRSDEKPQRYSLV